MRLACQALCSAGGFRRYSLSDREDRRVLANMFGIGIEQELVLLHPGVRSPWLGAYANDPRRKHCVARHECHEPQRMKQAAIAGRERVRAESSEDADQFERTLLVEPAAYRSFSISYLARNRVERA